MRIVISGVSRGIGEGLARLALESGDTIVGIGRKAPSWAVHEGAAFEFAECDMSDPHRLEQVCSGIPGPIDVLICSAATFAQGAGTIGQFHPDAMLEAFSVNTIAPLIMARTLKENLRSGKRRLIVLMSTGNASLQGNTSGGLLGYRLSKSALNQAARNLAAEWGAEGFSVVALNPGWVRTDMGGPDAELTVEEASMQILHFIRGVSISTPVNGLFLNSDGSPLPW